MTDPKPVETVYVFKGTAETGVTDCCATKYYETQQRLFTTIENLKSFLENTEISEGVIGVLNYYPLESITQLANLKKGKGEAQKKTVKKVKRKKRWIIGGIRNDLT